MTQAEWRPLSAWRQAQQPAASLAEALAAGSENAGAGRQAAALWVPGRIELFGKHTDYAGGRSLLTAIGRGMRLLVMPGRGRELCWRDLTRGLEARFDVGCCELWPGDWSNYLRAVTRRLDADFGPLERGAEVAMVSDLPRSAGLSSSSALIVAAFSVLAAVNPIRRHPAFVAAVGDSVTALAGYLGAVESGAPFAGVEADRAARQGVGTRGGSQDQTAILGCLPGEVSQFRFAPVIREQDVVFPGDWRLVVALSGVKAKKSGKARERFNHLAALAASGVEGWRRATGGDAPHLGAALEAAGGDVEQFLRAVAAGSEHGETAQRQEIIARARQFAIESGQLVPAATAAFAAADDQALGALAERSQRLAEDDLGNQLPATRALVRAARDAGALAASAFGAGFGGATWAVCAASETTNFPTRWRAAYTERYRPEASREDPQKAEFLLVEPAAAAGWQAWPASPAR